MTEFLDLFLDHALQWGAMVLLAIGLFIVMTRRNLIKKVVGLNIFQTAVFLLYIQAGYIAGGSAPIVDPAIRLYSNPLPHVLILTAIVVSVATTSLALALIVRIREAYGTIEEDEVVERDRR
jgi:multicomponent Na+:H+ antiporter subunit C